MIKIVKKYAKEFLRYNGKELCPYGTSQLAFMKQLLDLYKVEIIIDVGANIGQAGMLFRQSGYKTRIVSFEPIKYLYTQLNINAEKDLLWDTENVALGDRSGSMEINVSGGDAGSSSVLNMTDLIKTIEPAQQPVRKEIIHVTTLDNILTNYYPDGNKCFLKLDVQGYEKNVLEGALNVLDRVIGLRIEMSLVRSYEGETMFIEMLPYLYDLGFRLVRFDRAWYSKSTHEVYQVDGLFFRTDRVKHS